MMDVFDEPAVQQRLRYQDLIPAIADALAALSSGKVVQPVRAVLPVAPHHGFFAVMPAYAGALGAKLVTFYPQNVGIHTHHAVIVLFKAETGEPLAMMDGRLITEMRTAAASAVATQRLARADASVLAILGSGVQAKSHLRDAGSLPGHTSMRSAQPAPTGANWMTISSPRPVSSSTRARRHCVNRVTSLRQGGGAR